MTSKLESLCSRLKDQLFYMVLFATMFSVIGYLVPHIYYEFIDQTVYYSFNNPLAVNKQSYKQCEAITMTIDRISKVEGSAITVRNLFLIKDGQEIRVDSQKVDIILKKGDGIVYSTWFLPCFIDNGTYYYRGEISFVLNEIEKTADFYTEKFNIEN